MIQYKSVTAFAPATVANAGCGYDIMGFAINGIGDNVTITLQPENDNNPYPVLMSGPYGNLIPTERKKNTASVSVDAY